MFKKEYKFLFSFILAVILTLGLSISFQSLFAQWTPPSSAPPGGNVDAPIDTGSIYQSKAAGLEINGNLDLQGSAGEWRLLTFDRGTGNQQFFGDGSSALYFDSNHDTVTQMLFRDKQNTTYGRVYGSGNGANFGLLDGDGHWSYLAVKDNYTQFRINNIAKMTIRNGGNVGIGTTNPTAKTEIFGTGYLLRLSGSGTADNKRYSFYQDSDRLRLIRTLDSGAYGGDLVTFKGNGNVGIGGTTNPGYKLDINTDNAAPLRVTGDSSVVWNRASIYSRDTAAGGRTFAFGSRAGKFSISDETAGQRRLAIDNIGNVGIGTAVPGYKLHVSDRMKLDGANAGMWVESGVNDWFIGRSSPAGTNLRFYNTSDRLTITPGGNVGIGAPIPNGRLNVNGSTRIGIITDDDGSAAGYGDRLYFSGGDDWAAWNSDNSDSLWMARYNKASDQTDLRVSIGDGATASDAFAVGNAAQGYDVIYARMDGNVGIGTTNPSKKLDVNGDIITNAGITLGGVRRTTWPTGGDNLGNHTATQALNMAGFDINNAGDVTADAFIYSSDERLKKDVENVPDALERILNLRGVSFKWKKNNEQSLGLIAQEAEKVFPELVVTSQIDGMKAVKYGNLVAPLVEAIKEQQEQIDLLKKEIEQLRLSK